MMIRMVVILVLFSLLCADVQAWHITDTEKSNDTVVFVRGFLACPCSFSASGASTNSLHKVGDALTALNLRVDKLKLEHVNDTELETLARVRAEAATALKECAKMYQYQICINADHTLRDKRRFSMCNYDNTTEKNVVKLANDKWVTVGSQCPRREFDKENPELIMKNDTRVKKGYLWCYCSPENKEGKKPLRERLNGTINNLPERNDSRAVSKAGGLMETCALQFSYAKCVVADNELRKAAAENGYRRTESGADWVPMCTYDTQTGKNIGPDFLGGANNYTTLGPCRDNGDIFVMPAVASDQGTSAVVADSGNAAAPRANAKNEGCVHVKHLKGLTLQHKTHWYRHMLCLDEFCATPNHGIYYRGVYTSLKLLCTQQQRKCTASMGWVNNLKITHHTRVRVSNDVEISPYDFRFPWIAIWTVQLLQDLWDVFFSTLLVAASVSLLSGVASFALILLAPKSRTSPCNR